MVGPLRGGGDDQNLMNHKKINKSKFFLMFSAGYQLTDLSGLTNRETSFLMCVFPINEEKT